MTCLLSFVLCFPPEIIAKGVESSEWNPRSFALFFGDFFSSFAVDEGLYNFPAFAESMRRSDKVRIVSAVKSPESVCVSTCILQYNIPTFVKSMRRSDKVRIVSAVKLPGSACQYMYITVQHSYFC